MKLRDEAWRFLHVKSKVSSYAPIQGANYLYPIMLPIISYEINSPCNIARIGIIIKAGFRKMSDVPLGIFKATTNRPNNHTRK